MDNIINYISNRLKIKITPLLFQKKCVYALVKLWKVNHANTNTIKIQHHHKLVFTNLYSFAGFRPSNMGRRLKNKVA